MQSLGYSIGITEEALRERGVKKELLKKVKKLEADKEVLAVELTAVKENGVASFSKEKHKLESQVKSVLEAVAISNSKLLESEGKLALSLQREEDLLKDHTEVKGKFVALNCEKDRLVDELAKLKMSYDRVVEELGGIRKDYDILGERFDSSEKELESLRWKLKVALDPGVIIRDFQSSSTMLNLLKKTGEKAVNEYKGGEDYAGELDRAVKTFCKSSEFQKVLGEKTKLMLPYVVECCREFFRNDPERPRDGFEIFFIDWKKRINAEKAKARAAVRKQLLVLPLNVLITM